MQSTQVSVLEIQHPTTFYQYQDTVELLETLLQDLDMVIMLGVHFQQEIKTTMQQVTVTVVHRPTKVPGGTMLATVQTSMVSTMVDHTHPMLMV